MGTVYRAIAPSGEHVALKLIKREFARDRVFRRRFEREVRIAQQIRHSRIVAVLDAGEHDGIPYLAQRFVPNGSLAERLEREGALAVDAAVKVCTQIASGLDALHLAGLVHRDVKPGNILLDEQAAAYITDFGLAKDTQGTALTRPGQAIGSLDYMAPEQIRGDPVSPATDVYALACVMFECLVGKPVFADRRGMAVLWAHLQDTPPTVSAQRPDVPPDVGTAILLGLEKNPTRRPQGARTFANMLRAAAARPVHCI